MTIVGMFVILVLLLMVTAVMELIKAIAVGLVFLLLAVFAGAQLIKLIKNWKENE